MNLDVFLESITDNQRQIIEFLHTQFLSYPEVSYKMRFRIPFYDYKKWICYLNPVKPDKIELCFLRGKQLSNVQGLLEDRGRKKVTGIYIDDLKTLPLESILEIFAEAQLLEEEL